MDALPVTIIAGFLGAGKTTFLSRILSDPRGVRFGVLVNDFGAINIDADLVAQTGTDRVSLANGCVCCSIRDDLVAAIAELLEAPERPDHVVIEASGVSRPLAIVDALEDPAVADRLALDGIFCLVDAEQFERLDYADTELAMDQAFSSDLVLINKADLVDPDVLDRIEETLRDPMPRMRVLRTVNGDLPRDLLFGPEPGARETTGRQGLAHDDHDHGHHHDHDHDDAFEASSWETCDPLDEAAVRIALCRLPADLLRAKGILDLGGKRGVLHLVGKRRSLVVEDAPPPTRSQVVAIARRGRLDADAINSVLDACRPKVSTS